MTETLTAFYSIVLESIRHAGFSGFTKEIAGIFAIFLLLILFKILRKRRKKQGMTRSPADSASSHGQGAALPDEVEEEEWEEPSEEDWEQLENEAISAGARETPPSVATVEEELPAPSVEDASAGLFQRLKSGLSKTRQSLSKRFDAILSGNRRMDDDVLEEIEETLITADIGVPTTMKLMERISENAEKITSAEAFKQALKKEMRTLVDVNQPESHFEKPHVIMVVGVNGVGKTTTIGKLAAKFSGQGKKVLLAAADTFRAAAADQLEIWAQRANADIVRHKDKSDPAAVAFDSVDAATARGVDVVIIDTAGRLHTKVNLMEELKKIKRSIGKKIPSAPHETLLVVDATTGQNAVSQAKLFHADITVTGIVLTKLDGTAKGGIVLAICDLLKVPIRYIGVGEGVEDLQEFDPRLFVDALL